MKFKFKKTSGSKTGSWKRFTKKPNVGGTNIVDLVGEPRTPDFYCIGTEKAGTTWLWHWMNKHPDIGVPLSKELRFFDTSNTWDSAHFKSLKTFLESPNTSTYDPKVLAQIAEQIRLYYGGHGAYLRVFGSMSQQVVGEVSPQYCIQPLSMVRKMHSAAPNAKIIYMLRDPVDRIISGARMVIRREQAELDDTAVLRYSAIPIQRAFSDAESHLKKFESVFGAENVSVLFYDDVKNTPQAALTQCQKILGVKEIHEDPASLKKKINQGIQYQPSNALKATLYKSFRSVYAGLEKRFPDRVEGWRKRQ